MVRERDGGVLFRQVEVGQGGEHHGIVVLLCTILILQSHDFEALAANLASVDGALTHHVENLLVGVRIIFDTWTHANDNTP